MCVGSPVPRPGRGGGLQAVDVVLEAVAAHGVAAELRALAPEHRALHLSCGGKVLHSVTQWAGSCQAQTPPSTGEVFHRV